jgi:formate hydrogenlyase transcriptional activator
LLVKHFVELSIRRTGRQVDYIPQQTMDAFKSYSWPGNIRELQNLIERAVILSNDRVLPNPLPVSEIGDLPTSRPPSALKEIERDLILRALEDHGWMVGGSNGAAAKLGVKRTTLIAKMQKFGLSRPIVN